MSLDMAAIQHTLERLPCEVRGSEYGLILRRTTLQPFADAARANQAVDVEVTGVRLRNGCAMSPGIPLHLTASVSSPEELVEKIHQSWCEMINALELQSLAAAAPASAALTGHRQGGLMSSVLQRFA